MYGNTPSFKPVLNQMYLIKYILVVSRAFLDCSNQSIFILRPLLLFFSSPVNTETPPPFHLLCTS